MKQLIEFMKPNFEFEDDRGKLNQLFRDGYKQVNYIFTKSGVIRGEHYHKNNKEAFYVISGSFELILEDLNSDAKEKHILKTGDFFAINPYLKHSFNYLEDTRLISMYSKGVEEENGKDIYN